MTKDPSVDELTRFVEEIYDTLETNIFDLMFNGLELLNLEKVNEQFRVIKEKYRTANVVYWATLLRATSMFNNHINNWVELLEETKVRIEKEFGAEAQKDILFGMV